MAKKRLNKKLVLLLSVFVSICMIVLSIMMLRQLQSADPQRFVDLAKAAEAEGNFKQSALLYLKAFERSKDAMHLVHRGQALLEDGNLGGGLRVLQEALIVQPDLTEVHVELITLRLELARLYRSVNEWQSLLEAAEQFLEVDAEKTPADLAFAHHAQGLALVNLGAQDESYPDAGLVELEKARDLEAAHVDYAIDLATRYVLRDRKDDAEAILRELTAIHTLPGPDASQAELGLARFLTSGDYLDEAEPHFIEAVRLAADDQESVVQAKSGYAVHLSQRWAKAVRSGADKAEADGYLARAESMLQEAIETDPTAFEPPLQLSLLYKLAGRHDDVLDVCETRLRRGFSRKGTEGPRNRVSVFGLNIRASEACVDKALAESDVQKRGELLEQAEQYLADARGEFPNHPPVFHQEGRIRLAQGHDRAALEAFRAADERYKTFARIEWDNKTILAGLHLKLGEPGAAMSVLSDVVEEARTQRATDSGFWFLYARVLFQTGDLDGARTWANRILAFDKNHAGARQLRAAVAERQGRQIDDPGAVPPSVACLLEAKQHALDGDDEGAITVILDCLKEDPANLGLVRAAVGELLSRDRADDARAAVARALEINPESRHLKEIQVLLRDDLSDEQRDAAVLDLIATEDDAYRRALHLLAFHVRNGNATEAVKAISEAERLLIEKATPTAQQATIAQHRALLKEKLRMAAMAGDETAMAEARDAAIRHDVDGAGGQSLVGLYHIHRKEWEPAVAALKAALQVQATDARALAHLGQCLIMLDRIEEAQAQLRRAIDINPNDPIAHRALGSLAQQSGDIEAVERHLAVCERLIPNDPWVITQVLARGEKEDPAAAIAKREAALAANPDDVFNLFRLALLCETVDDRTKADGYFQRLLDLRPDQKSVVYSVALYYERTDRADDGLDVIKRYVDTRTTDDDRANGSILTASYYLKRGKTDLAEATLLEAVDSHETLDLAQSLGEFYLPLDGRARDALKWYDRAVTLAEAAQHPQLSRLLVARVRCLLNRQINDVQEARRSVDDLLSRDPGNLPALLLDSEIAARAGSIDDAVRSLTRYLEKVPESPRVLSQRAQHYIAQGKTSLAIDDLEAIKSHDPLALELAPRLLLAQLYSQSKREDAWIAELESLYADAPDAPVAIEALVRAYVRLGRFAEADGKVTAQINRHTDDPDARWYALRGSVSFALRDFDKALADYRVSAELDGFSGGTVAAVLDAHDRAKRFAEGVAYYRNHADAIENTYSVLARYGLLLARSGDSAGAVATFREAAGLASAESNAAVGAVMNRMLLAFSSQQALALFKDTPVAPAAARANDRILIRLHRRENHIDEAVQLAARLLDTAGTDAVRAQLLEEQGDAYNQGGKADLARQAYEEALKYDDHNWVLLNNLAYLLAENLGAFDMAKPYAERAVALAETTYTLDTLGWIYVGLGDYTRGVAELNRAIRLDPSAAESYYHLGEAYRRDGQFREAVDILERGVTLASSPEASAVRTLIDASLDKAKGRDDAP